MIAKFYSLSQADKEDFSLAEIFASPNFSKNMIPGIELTAALIGQSCNDA